MSLKLEVAMRITDLHILADAMRSYPNVRHMNTKTCALEGSELFGSTKRTLNLPPWLKYDSHSPNRVK